MHFYFLLLCCVHVAVNVSQPQDGRWHIQKDMVQSMELDGVEYSYVLTLAIVLILNNAEHLQPRPLINIGRHQWRLRFVESCGPHAFDTVAEL